MKRYTLEFLPSIFPFIFSPFHPFILSFAPFFLFFFSMRINATRFSCKLCISRYTATHYESFGFSNFLLLSFSLFLFLFFLSLSLSLVFFFFLFDTVRGLVFASSRYSSAMYNVKYGNVLSLWPRRTQNGNYN